MKKSWKKIKIFKVKSSPNSEDSIIFFHQNIWRCHTCHKPIVKARIDTNDFSNYHQNLICTCRRKKNAPNVVAPAAHGVNIVSPAAHGGVGPVNRAEFNALQNSVNQLTVRINNMDNNLHNLTIYINNMINNMNNFMAQINQRLDTLEQQHNRIKRCGSLQT